MSEAQDDFLDAGEYVLGTLAGEARAQFLRRLVESDSLRAHVVYWQEKLAALNDATPETPREIVWTQLAFRAGLHRLGAAAAPRTLRVWQAMTGLATAASALLGVGLWQQQQKPPQILVQVQEKVVERAAPASYLGLLQIAGSDTRWMVSLTPDRKAIQAHTVGTHSTAAGKYLHLWWLNKSGPVSLGVLPDSGDARMTLPENLDLEGGSGLAVSLEAKDDAPKPGEGPRGAVLVAAPVMKAI